MRTISQASGLRLQASGVKRAVTVRERGKCWRLASFLFFVTIVSTACGGDGDFKPQSPPADRPALEALWARVQGETVTDKPFPVAKADLKFMRDVLGATGTDEQLVAAIQQRKLLAAKGAEHGLGAEFGVAIEYRRALARAYLRQKMDDEHSPESVPDELWEQIYWDPNVRPMFDHRDTFFVTDVQMVCCKGNPKLCAKDPFVQACMRDTEPQMWDLHTELSKQEYPTAKQLRKRAKELQEQRFGELAIKEYSFQYDFSLSHEEQRSYTVFNRNVAMACRDAGVAKIGRPTQSNHGWHIVYVREFHPERHQAFGDPGVQEELEKRFYPGIKHQDAIKLLNSLVKKHPVKLYEDTLRELDWASITGIK
jgi:hypothetical protein